MRLGKFNAYPTRVLTHECFMCTTRIEKQHQLCYHHHQALRSDLRPHKSQYDLIKKFFRDEMQAGRYVPPHGMVMKW